MAQSKSKVVGHGAQRSLLGFHFSLGLLFEQCLGDSLTESGLSTTKSGATREHNETDK